MPTNFEDILLERLTPRQQEIVRSDKQRTLVIAGAGSGKTEVMARKIAWWVLVDKVPREQIVAFTFTEKAAEEMKFRIREKMRAGLSEGEEITLGGMYVGTIHGFCLRTLRKFWPDGYHHYDILDEASRLALVQRGYFNVLGLQEYKEARKEGMYASIDSFLEAYDFLNEFDKIDVTLASPLAPDNPATEQDWCRKANLSTVVGDGPAAKAFAKAAARYYAYLHCRRFLDFSTSQSELSRLFQRHPEMLTTIQNEYRRVVVDEVQDINPVQSNLISAIVGQSGYLMAVGDHRQAIYGWRGGKVEIMGQLYQDTSRHPAGQVFELVDNFRSTPRIIGIANEWSNTISRVRDMANPPMGHGNKDRVDYDRSHVGMIGFSTREEEASWIADRIKQLVDRESGTGATHNAKGKSERGISYSDIVLLLRSSTDAKVYAETLKSQGIPVVYRAGPDLFSSEEIMLFMACLAESAGVDEFVGNSHSKSSFPVRIREVLECNPTPEAVMFSAVDRLQRSGLEIDRSVAERLLATARFFKKRVFDEQNLTQQEIEQIGSESLRKTLKTGLKIRRLFTQVVYQAFLQEANVGKWDNGTPRGETAMYHLGQLSTLIKQMESPGWTSPYDYRSQIIALSLWASQNARAQETPLLLPPDAVTLATIHGVKGLEFPVVFLADVKSRRFPSQFAKRAPKLPFDGDILKHINPTEIADNDNYDAERRLMYVAMTRAERYLFITHPEKGSPFYTALTNIAVRAGAAVTDRPEEVCRNLRLIASASSTDFRLNTSFSDIRYFLACPHDFYLRKILGFTAPIDQTFGYGKGLHNLMRSVHSAADKWAAMAKSPQELQSALRQLIEGGLFYLRYTTGDIAENMRNRAVKIVQDYVRNYAEELDKANFDPEKDFETLIHEAQVLVSGAIDLIRLDDPPRVTLVDFKSGERDNDVASGLDAEEMQLQITLYGLAAKSELEYEPERGLIRYLGEEDASRDEVSVNLSAESIEAARQVIVQAAREIRNRDFYRGAKKLAKKTGEVRCAGCDFSAFCGLCAKVAIKGK
jgi:DNA helicase-2/ATP-dependent DNA helicase PcrA